jgi:hypothetical protein
MPCPDVVKIVATGVPMKMKQMSAIIVLLMLSTSMHAAQKFNVKVIDRQNNSSTATYVVPGHSSSNSNANANCSGDLNYATCNGSANTTSSSTPALVGSYQVQGATLSLQLPDGRIAVVNCASKLNWDNLNGAYRSCRMPLVNDIEAEFDGDKAKLEWSVSIDGKKKESETYKVLAVLQPQTVSAQEAPASIEAPNSDAPTANSGFPSRWKSMTTGLVRTLRFEGEHIYTEMVLPPVLVNAGAFSLVEVKKDGDKYVGKVNFHMVERVDGGGASCSGATPIELTLVTPDRIEGRTFSSPSNAKLDWNTCSYSLPPDWQPFTWIPVK